MRHRFTKTPDGLTCKRCGQTWKSHPPREGCKGAK